MKNTPKPGKRPIARKAGIAQEAGNRCQHKKYKDNSKNQKI
jgi:hypothetical protein